MKRVRKPSPHPQKNIRLHRAEFGHDVLKNNNTFLNFRQKIHINLASSKSAQIAL